MHHHHQTQFDQKFWQDHWQERPEHHDTPAAPHPYIQDETHHLTPGTALDAGCGRGAEARWLAAHGWRVTGADISETALDMARDYEQPGFVPVEWVHADLTTWQPTRQWDLVVTSYAHTPMPQLEFYRHIARWVAPGGTLLIVAHLDDHGADHQHPAETTVSVEDIKKLFAGPQWRIETARSQTRQMGSEEHSMVLHDAIIRIHHQLSPDGQ